MDFTLSYNNKEEVLVFPVVPNAGIQLSRDQDNQAFDGINHELQALGNMKLATFSITSFFPLKRYSFLRPYSSINGWHYVRVIEAVRKRKIPFRALHLDNNGQEVFNLPVTVENFEYWIDQAGDIGYTIDFKEYRFANGSAATLSNPKNAAGEKTQTAAQLNASTGSSSGGTFAKRYTKSDATIIAKIMYGEARGIKSKTEIACIGWCILNRVDAGMGKNIQSVALAAHQFYYKAGAPTVSDHGYDLVALATDVLDRWSREKAGQTNVGRVLPKQYKWYAGDGSHNWFYPSWPCKRAQRWNFKSVQSPYPN
nr:MAG TPA: tail assembly protein [Caudoviricetes sp.]